MREARHLTLINRLSALWSWSLAPCEVTICWPSHTIKTLKSIHLIGNLQSVDKVKEFFSVKFIFFLLTYMFMLVSLTTNEGGKLIVGKKEHKEKVPFPTLD